MSDETVQRHLEAVIRRDGRGEVREGDEAQLMQGASDDELRALVMQYVIAIASESGDAVRLRTVDVDGVYHLVVFPDGEIAEEGEIEPLQASDTELWVDAVGVEEAADGGDAGELGDAGDAADSGDAAGFAGAPEFAEGSADGGAVEHHDGGYAAEFGAGFAGDDAHDDVHETIQLPRPGMMRDEPPAVTGMRPIIPPTGAPFTGSIDAPGGHEQPDADDIHHFEDDGGPAGDPVYEGEHGAESAFDADLAEAQFADGAFADGTASQRSADAWPDAHQYDAHEPVGDEVVVDWGTGGLHTVDTGTIEQQIPGGARADEGEHVDGAAGSWTEPTPSGAMQRDAWEPNFPRRGAGAEPTAPEAEPLHEQSHPHTGGLPTALPQVRDGGYDDRRPGLAGGPTLGDFLADKTTRKSLPAERGWRASVRRGTGGLVRLGPGARERAERDEIAGIQRTFDGPKTIVVVNPKGGAHKTTATLMIAATLGMHRGGYTLAWDNNETRGTLGWRSLRGGHNRTAVDLLRQLSHFEISGGATIADVDRFVRNQGEAKFDVLASDDDAASAAIIDAEAFSRLHRTLSRFYRVLVIDTGNNMRASNWEAALDVADQLVIVSTAREDTAASAAWLADGLRERGHGSKLANAVTILSSPSAKEDPALQERLRQHFAQLTRAVVEVPYDEEFVGGGELDIPHLRAETRDAWRHAAAVIAEGL